MNVTAVLSPEVFAALLLTVGGVGTYWFQKHLDRRVDLVARRKAAYEAYLACYLGAASGKDGLEKLNAARMTIALLAPDSVLRVSADFDDYAIRTSSGQPRDSGVFRAKFTSVLAAMRADVFEKTQMSEADLQKAVPVR